MLAGPTHTSATPHVAAMLTCTGARAVRPRRYWLACADHNSYLTGMVWSSWGTVTAKGTGTYVADNCTPNCAAGTLERYRAQVSAGTPEQHALGWLFTQLVVYYPKRGSVASVGYHLPTKALTG